MAAAVVGRAQFPNPMVRMSPANFETILSVDWVSKR